MKKKIKIILNNIISIFFSNIEFIQRNTTYRKEIFSEKQVAKICKNENSPWNSSFWINQQIYKMQNNYKFSNKTIHFACFELCLNSLKSKNKEINIIDYGGGGGQYFQETKKYIKANKMKDTLINYTLSDSKDNLDICRNYLKSSKNCKLILKESDYFFKWANKTDKEFDLVLICAVIQYLDDWEKSLDELINLAPEFICVLKTPIAADANKTARVVQNVKTKKGYCGPAMLTLFPPNSIENYFTRYNYYLLQSFPDQVPQKDYFKYGCDDINYQYVKPWNYVFKKIQK